MRVAGGRAPGDAFDQKVERVASGLDQGVNTREGRGSATRARARAGAGAAQPRR